MKRRCNRKRCIECRRALRRANEDNGIIVEVGVALAGHVVALEKELEQVKRERDMHALWVGEAHDAKMAALKSGG